jgi:hypothetical protein
MTEIIVKGKKGTQSLRRLDRILHNEPISASGELDCPLYFETKKKIHGMHRSNVDVFRIKNDER